MKKKGTLVVFEGLDGSGKATQAAALASYFTETGRKTRQITFPDYASEGSALVRLYLSGELGGADEVNAYAASSFYAADRYVSYHTDWEKEYRDGYTIIADRYSTSNAVHQMSKLPRDEWDDYLDWMCDYEYARLGLPAPDIVIYLDMDPEASKKLLAKRYSQQNTGADIHERDFAYLLRCRTAALYACEKLGWRTVNCSSGGEPLPILQILDQVKLLTIDV